MNLSDKLSPEDRRAYAEEYGPLAKLRDAYVACGDQVNAKRIRQQISAMSRRYQLRTKPVWRGFRSKPWTNVWIDESSQFTQDMWNKLGAIPKLDFAEIEERVLAYLTSPESAESKLQQILFWPRCAGKSTFFKHQLEAYRMMNEKFCPPKEPQMLKITNSSDMPEYSTDGRACVNVSHLLSKEQMLEVAKLAFQTYGDECMRAMGINAVEYDQHRAIKQFKRGMSVYPHVLHNFIEQHGYRMIQPYTLEVAMRQVFEAERVYPHHFKPKSELPERFYNHAIGHQAPDVAHFTKEAALAEAERIARRTNAEVRTYQLVSTTTIEDVPTTTKQVVRRP